MFVHCRWIYACKWLVAMRDNYALCGVSVLLCIVVYTIVSRRAFLCAHSRLVRCFIFLTPAYVQRILKQISHRKIQCVYEDIIPIIEFRYEQCVHLNSHPKKCIYILHAPNALFHSALGILMKNQKKNHIGWLSYCVCVCVECGRLRMGKSSNVNPYVKYNFYPIRNNRFSCGRFTRKQTTNSEQRLIGGENVFSLFVFDVCIAHFLSCSFSRSLLFEFE